MSPADVAAYEGGFAPASAAGSLQRDRMPLTIASICFSVSIPPARCAKAGIDVPRTPSAMMARIERSSTIARYTGLASAIAAPPRPLAPWQPAQLSAYNASNSTTSFGASVIEPARGWPGGVPQPTSSTPSVATSIVDAESSRTCVTTVASPRGEIVPGASMPARRANETFSSVGIGDWRTTTTPATMPNATCDAMNQNQSMRLASSGFRRLSVGCSSPDHNTGTMSPPRTIGRRGNMGSIAP